MDKYPYGYGDSHTLDFPAVPKLGESKPEEVLTENIDETREPHDYTD